MSRVVTFGEIMARIATPGFARFQQAMPGSVNVTFAVQKHPSQLRWPISASTRLL